jgi:hypothetical protein
MMSNYPHHRFADFPGHLFVVTPLKTTGTRTFVPSIRGDKYRVHESIVGFSNFTKQMVGIPDFLARGLSRLQNSSVDFLRIHSTSGCLPSVVLRDYFEIQFSKPEVRSYKILNYR